MGPNYYKDLLDEYTGKIYQVEKGESIQFIGDDSEVYLTKGKKYKVVKTDDEAGIKNARVLVINDTKKESWHDTSDFEVKLKKESDLINENNLRNYIKKVITDIY